MSDNKQSETSNQPADQAFRFSLLAFVIPVVVILSVVAYFTAGGSGAKYSMQNEEEIAARLQKVGSVEVQLAQADRELKSGQEVYDAQCAVCHATGVSDAPKFGDAGDWQPRLGAGYEALLKSSLEGKGAMAPQGGGAFSDLEIGRAVVYMANAGGGDFADPAEEGEDGEAAAESDAAEDSTAAAETAAPAAEDSTETAAAEEEQPAAEEVAAGEASAGAPVAAAAADIDLEAGKALYNQACLACHAAGVAGAPKLGDKKAWEPLIASGMDAMMKIAIEGKGAMPPRGATNATDAELRNAVEYMVSEAQ